MDQKTVIIKGHPNYSIDINGVVTNITTGKILKPSIDKYGYKYVHLALGKRGKFKQCMIHRAVAEAFIPNLENKPQVNHKDGNKLNNNVNNLEWATRSENIRHMYNTGLVKNKDKIIEGLRRGAITRGEQTRRPIIAIDNISGLIFEFNSMGEITNDTFCMSRTSVLNRIKGIVKDERWSFIG